MLTCQQFVDTEAKLPAEPAKLPANLHEAHCSFCRKGQQDVNALIAGPGVYICNECVEMAGEVFQKLGRVEKKVPFVAAEHFRGLDSARLLDLVGRIEPVHQDVAGQQDLIVGILREREVSWADIGASLGVSRQAVWRRFAKGPDGE
jgi:hypothetical protein